MSVFDDLVVTSLVVFEPQRRYKIPKETPSATALNIRGWENYANIAFYLGNGKDRPMVTTDD